ncbi:16S rRNA (guanine1516-N2)-methyltransferase [Lachnospiraceae bacterium KH1T2]|nr:16S rRNA (guanine1516-N2)-methyltransferase [Lachnospiraceae bacterium KH1T2]
MDNNLDTGKTLIIYASDEKYQERAQKLAKALNVPLAASEDELKAYALSLVYNDNGLTLSDGERSMHGDFTKMLPRLKPNNLNRELIVKAGKIKSLEPPLRAVDATAGMGEDSLLLAAAGFEVELFEYDPVIAALLDDTLKRSALIPELSEITGRMHLHAGDSIKGLSELSFKPDMILLDPMFPERQKSALVKKKFQLIHQLERPCDDEEALLNAAIKAAPKKIVIKRPLKGPFLAGVKPDYSLSGKAIRCDCLINLQRLL